MDLDEIRSYYAEEIRAVANIQNEALVAAFARIPRERFLGPGPWKIVTPESWKELQGKQEGSYRITEDDDPRHLYHNVLVAIDSDRSLNNGQPSGLAMWLDALELSAGDTVLHIGCGVGYYTAIIAEVVGPGGHVTGVEIDPALAERARQNLSYLTNTEVIQGSGTTVTFNSSDAIFVNAGVTHPQESWLDGLKSEGRLILPFTISRDDVSTGGGFMLRVKRMENGYDARVMSPVAIFSCIGGRDPELNDSLRAAMSRGTWGTVRSLRRDSHAPGDDCWLHGNRFCLSTS